MIESARRSGHRASGSSVAGLALLALAVGVWGFVAPSVSSAATTTKPPAIKHVFLINLENKSFDETWGASSPAPYLSQTLVAKGQFLSQYFAIGHVSLDNYIAQISGQGPNKQTQLDCSTYTDFVSTGMGALGQVLGDGCVYPTSVKTIADQLTAKKLTWKGYMEDMGNSPTEPKTCRHPEIGAKDTTLVAKADDGYATRHNPFVYFHSIIDSPICNTNVVPLDRFEADLASVKTTPNFSMITPNLCNDGHDATCPGGILGGLVASNAWLEQWVPKILASPAFKKDGLLIVTFDEAEFIGASADATSCCNAPKPPNVENASAIPPGPGGGRVGAVLVSPFIKPGSTNDTPYNHYGLLCSMEDVFGLKHLGYAGQPGLTCFGADVYKKASTKK
ncbi:MAG: alkaline phosphatase family protein [Acidimicrobiia bacterium]